MKRFARRQVKGVKFTRKDRQIVEAVWEARYMTNQQIGRLFFKPSTMSYCRKRLRLLYDKGYLSKRVVEPCQPDIYYLAARGRHYIEKTTGLEREAVAKLAGVSGSGTVFPLLHLRHDLRLSSLYVEARKTCELYGWEYQWKNTRMLERELERIEPDAWLSVSNGSKTLAYYIEYTDRLSSLDKADKKLAGYQQLWEKQGYTPVLWFACSKTRAGQIMGRVEKHPFRDYFLVAVVDTKQQFLVRPIWRMWNREEPIVLLKPKEVILYKG